MQPSRLVYRDFPPEIRRVYREVFQARDGDGRHGSLLAFAETALGYLASLVLSDYRSRCETPSSKVELLLDRLRSGSLTFGRTLELTRASVAAISDPLIPGPTNFPARPLGAVDRFAAIVDGLKAAVDGLSRDSAPSAINVPVHVQRSLVQTGAGLTWWDGWGRLVEYRNKVVHPIPARWPVHSQGYCEVMTPFLHDALIELLTEPEVQDAVLRHPVVDVDRISQDESGGFMHAVHGEAWGVWFEEEVTSSIAVTERWAESYWKATPGSSFVMERDDDGRAAIRALFCNVNDSPPPAVDMRKMETAHAGIGEGKAAPALRRKRINEGRGSAPGTCGEFAQGVLSDGTWFHVTCPINKSAAVIASVRPAEQLSVIGLLEHHRKLGLAVEYAAAYLELGAVEVTIRHWTDLDIAKGMGSSTADVLAAIRALANAVGEELGADVEGRLAAQVESSDGTMYPGIAAVNHRTCELVRSWDWYPEFAIVMLVPHEIVNTHSVSFASQESFGDEYDEILRRMDAAIAERSAEHFAAQSTRSAELNGRFLLNPYARKLSTRLDEFGALGVNVGHTGTVCGLLFPNTEAGRSRASDARFEVRRQFDDLKDVTVVTTPHCGLDPAVPATAADTR